MSLSMAQLGYVGYLGAENGNGNGAPPRPLPPSPPVPPPVDAIGAYLRAKERVAALTASMQALSPATTTNLYVSRSMPDINVAVEPPPITVRTVRSNGDLAKLALVGVISGLAVWAMTRRKK